MAQEQKNGVSLKLLVDKKKNSVVFAESESDFVDVLCSFLTIPMGKVVSVASKSQEKTLGSFNNLYQSVENTDSMHFHFGTDACKSMLLDPRSSAEGHCGELKLKIDDSDPTIDFLCSSEECRRRNSWRRSLYSEVHCGCLYPTNYISYTRKIESYKDGSVFIKGADRFIITDDLRVLLVSTEAILSLFSKHGITNNSELEERILTLDTTQVKTMLIYSFGSRKVLTNIFLANEQDLRPGNIVSFLKSNSGECGPEVSSDDAIRVKLIISKSKRTLCYAEASRDFVNLLFSFLTVPIGHIAKQIHGESHLDICIDQLYKSVVELDDNRFRTIDDKQLLVSPSLSYGFSYRNDLLGIQKSPSDGYYSWLNKTDDGFLTGPTMFVVSDCLKVTPISAFVCLSILKDINVSSDDIVEQVVNVGKNEALLLLVHSLLSENSLTNTFLKPKQEK